MSGCEQPLKVLGVDPSGRFAWWSIYEQGEGLLDYGAIELKEDPHTAFSELSTLVSQCGLVVLETQYLNAAKFQGEHARNAGGYFKSVSSLTWMCGFVSAVCAHLLVPQRDCAPATWRTLLSRRRLSQKEARDLSVKAMALAAPGRGPGKRPKGSWPVTASHDFAAAFCMAAWGAGVRKLSC